MKQKYGDKICLLATSTCGIINEGNAAGRHRKSNRIARVAPGGRYIITSANSLTNYCKPQNVLAMGRYIKEYGNYPIQI